ncbi:MAG: GNAT family N-acetyltransferase [Myxococcota bacterium]
MADVFNPPRLHTRAFMIRSLHVPLVRSTTPRGYQVKTWDARRIADVARVEFDAYAGTLDQRLFHDSLNSVDACKEHLWQTTMRRGPFVFSPACSLMLLKNGEVCGFTVVSIADQSASLDNIAVHPEHRGGTGRALLVASMQRMVKIGLRSVSLTVTTANRRALRLYRDLGFVELARTPMAVPHRAPRER